MEIDTRSNHVKKQKYWRGLVRFCLKMTVAFFAVIIIGIFLINLFLWLPPIQKRCLPHLNMLLCEYFDQEVYIERIIGIFPFNLSLENVVFESEYQKNFQAKLICFKFNVEDIFIRQLNFSVIAKEIDIWPNLIKKIQFTEKSNKDNSSKVTFRWPKLPFNFQINSFSIQKVKIHFNELSSPIEFNFEGNLIYDASYNDIQIETALMLKNFDGVNAWLKINGDGKKQIISTMIKATKPIKKTNFIFNDKNFTIPSLDIQADLKGHVSAWASTFDLATEQFNYSHVKGEVSICYENNPSVENPFYLLLSKRGSMHGNLLLGNQFKINFTSIDCDTPISRISGRLSMEKNLNLRACQLHVYLKNHYFFHEYNLALDPKTEIHTDISGNLKAPNIQLSMSSPVIKINDIKMKNFALSSELNYYQPHWKGYIKSSFHLKNDSITTFHTHVNTDPSKYLSFYHIKLVSDYGNIMGNVHHNLQNHITSSFLDITIPDLHSLEKLTKIPASGNLSAQINLYGTLGEEQSLQFKVKGKNIKVTDFFAQNFLVQGNFENLLENPQGNIFADIDQLYFKHIFLDTFKLGLSKQKEVWNYECHATGNFKNNFSIENMPCEIKGEGDFQLSSKNTEIKLSKFIAKLGSHLATVEKPIYFKWKEKNPILASGFLKVDSGYISLNLNTLQSCQGELKIQQTPLDFISLFFPNLYSTGELNIHATVNGTITNPNCDIEGKISHFMDTSKNSHKALEEAVFTAHYRDKILKGSLSIQNLSNKLGSAYFELPISLSIYPLSYDWNFHQPFNTKIQLDAPLKKLLSFFSISCNDWNGYLKGAIQGAGTLQNPELKGELKLENGVYTDVDRSISLSPIDIHLQCQDQKIHIESCTICNKEGQASITGNIEIQPSLAFPFKFNVGLHNFPLHSHNQVRESYKGNISLEASQNNIVIAGDLESLCPIAINSNTVQNKTIYQYPKIYFFKHLMELWNLDNVNYNLRLTIPKGINFSTKDLFSEWRGNIHLTGTNKNPVYEGLLTLISGQSTLIGKKVLFSQGNMYFNKTSLSQGIIDMYGFAFLDKSDISIRLHGPLSEIILSLDSAPYLPTAQILSRLAYNKDLNQISLSEKKMLTELLLQIAYGNFNPLHTISSSYSKTFSDLHLDSNKDFSYSIYFPLLHDLTTHQKIKR